MKIAFIVYVLSTNLDSKEVLCVYTDTASVKRDYPQFDPSNFMDSQHVNLGQHCFIICPTSLKD